jgi:hypothetical protein
MRNCLGEGAGLKTTLTNKSPVKMSHIDFVSHLSSPPNPPFGPGEQEAEKEERLSNNFV